MSAPVENLVQRLHAKRNGKGWIANCPAHDDRKPSLSINEGSDGRALLKCHAGCNTDDVNSPKERMIRVEANDKSSVVVGVVTLHENGISYLAQTQYADVLVEESVNQGGQLLNCRWFQEPEQCG